MNWIDTQKHNRGWEINRFPAFVVYFSRQKCIGDEKSDSQRFGIDFFTNVLGIEDVLQKIKFEKRVMVDGQIKYIDVYIPETRVLIEQKRW